MGGFLTGSGSSPNDRKGQLLEEVRKREGKTLEDKDFQRLQLPMSPPVTVTPSHMILLGLARTMKTQDKLSGTLGRAVSARERRFGAGLPVPRGARQEWVWQTWY